MFSRQTELHIWFLSQTFHQPCFTWPYRKNKRITWKWKICMWSLYWPAEDIWHFWPFNSTKKMEHYGIKGLANKWFRSNLTGQTQYTSVNGFDSEYRDMKYGIPQGSVLGPLLFLIYINDLRNAIKFSTVYISLQMIPIFNI